MISPEFWYAAVLESLMFRFEAIFVKLNFEIMKDGLLPIMMGKSTFDLIRISKKWSEMN
jgi:hypothetical protein